MPVLNCDTCQAILLMGQLQLQLQQQDSLWGVITLAFLACCSAETLVTVASLPHKELQRDRCKHVLIQ